MCSLSVSTFEVEPFNSQYQVKLCAGGAHKLAFSSLESREKAWYNLYFVGSERPMKMKEQKKIKKSVLDAKYDHNSQKLQ